ncbi:cupin domain-containing protein [Rhizobium azibense]|nr:cupin domain [Rhizobium azibense]
MNTVVHSKEMQVVAVVNFETELQGVTEHWSPRVVAQVNDQYVKVAKVLGQIAWHKHDNEDELFLVISGQLKIEFEGGKETVLNPGEMCVVPRGVLHNPVAEEECSIVLIETVTTKHTGDIETPLTKSIESQISGRTGASTLPERH